MVQTSAQPTPRPRPSTDPIVKRGFRADTPVAVPLDFLDNLSSIAQRNLERRPPKLQLQGHKSRDGYIAELSSIVAANPVASKETADLAYQVAELVVRRQAAVQGSGDAKALAGLKTLDRMARMFEHIYLLSTGTNQIGVSK